MATYGKNIVEDNDYKDVLIGTLYKLLWLYEKMSVDHFESEEDKEANIKDVKMLIDTLIWRGDSSCEEC
jgi:hypothetical protein